MANEIRYNGSVIASPEAGQTVTLKCAGMKMESDVVVDVAEQSGGSGTDANIVPLLVGGAGTYDANSPVLVTETFTGGGTPDAVVSTWGVTLPYFKAKKLIATKDILTLARNEELADKLFVTVDGSVIPICQMDLSGDESGLMASMEGAPVILWFIDVEGAGYSKEDGFEDNSVYILDIWNLLGVTGEATLTALGIPDKPADGFMPVEVAIPYTDELTIAPKYQSTQHFENVYVGKLRVTPPPITTLTVTPSTQKQTFSYGKDNSGNQAAYSSVTVEAVDVSKLRMLCDIELETLPTKTDYAPDEWLDTDGGVILCHYTDGSVFRLNLSNRYVFGFPTAIEEGAGKHTLVVQYTEGSITCRTTYDITVWDYIITASYNSTAPYSVNFGIPYEGERPSIENPSFLYNDLNNNPIWFHANSAGSGTLRLYQGGSLMGEYLVKAVD